MRTVVTLSGAAGLSAERVPVPEEVDAGSPSSLTRWRNGMTSGHLEKLPSAAAGGRSGVNLGKG